MTEFPFPEFRDAIRPCGPWPTEAVLHGPLAHP